MADVAVVKIALNTGTGTQDFTSSGFGTPAGALFYLTQGTINGTVVNHGILGVGATDGTRQISITGHSKDNVATSLTGRQGTTNRCLTVLDQDGGDLVIASFNSWITDGVRLTISAPAPAGAYLLTVVLLGGTGVTNVYTNLVTTPAVQDTATTVNTVGFQADALLTFDSATGNFSDSNGAGTGIGLGLVKRESANPHTQFSTCLYDINGISPTGLRAYADSTRCAHDANAATGVAVEIRDFTSSGFAAYTRNTATAMPMGYVAIKFSASVGVKVLAIDSPTATGTQSITGVGFTPQFGLLLLNKITARDTRTTDSTGEVIGVSLFTSTTQSCVQITSDDSVATSNAESVTHSRPIFIRNENATFMDATFTQFTSDGVTFNYATANATPRKWVGLFIQDPTSTSPAGTDSLPMPASDTVQPVTVTLSIAESG